MSFYKWRCPSRRLYLMFDSSFLRNLVPERDHSLEVICQAQSRPPIQWRWRERAPALFWSRALSTPRTRRRCSNSSGGHPGFGLCPVIAGLGSNSRPEPVSPMPRYVGWGQYMSDRGCMSASFRPVHTICHDTLDSAAVPDRASEQMTGSMRRSGSRRLSHEAFSPAP